jgi:hypothetical protein
MESGTEDRPSRRHRARAGHGPLPRDVTGGRAAVGGQLAQPWREGRSLGRAAGARPERNPGAGGRWAGSPPRRGQPQRGQSRHREPQPPRCPEVPAYLFAPETCPGGALQVGSGATDPAQLLGDLRVVSCPLLGELQTIDRQEAYLDAWAELGAHRNRQRFAYRATVAGLLEREGWELQAPGPEHCSAAAAITAELAAIAEKVQAAEDAALITAPPLTTAEATELQRRRRTLEPSERAALDPLPSPRPDAPPNPHCRATDC